jgi:hypothetical protein
LQKPGPVTGPGPAKSATESQADMSKFGKTRGSLPSVRLNEIAMGAPTRSFNPNVTVMGIMDMYFPTQATKLQRERLPTRNEKRRKASSKKVYMEDYNNYTDCESDSEINSVDAAATEQFLSHGFESESLAHCQPEEELDSDSLAQLEAEVDNAEYNGTDSEDESDSDPEFQIDQESNIPEDSELLLDSEPGASDSESNAGQESDSEIENYQFESDLESDSDLQTQTLRMSYWLSMNILFNNISLISCLVTTNLSKRKCNRNK